MSLQPVGSLRSRMHRSPRGRRIEVAARDLELFKVLDRYRYLPSNFLHALVGGNAAYHKARMTDLFHEGWLDKPVLQWEAINARYRFDCYELAHRAKSALEERGLLSDRQIGSGGAFRHELMVCVVMASFEYSARCHGISLGGWRDVLAAAPAGVRMAEAPFVVPMSISAQGRTLTRPLRPDGLPFTLTGARRISFIGFEADRHHEPLHPADLHSRHSSILAKLLQYQHLVRERLFQTRFNMSNVCVPFITINDEHMRNMMKLALQLSDGVGYKWLLFRCMPDLLALERSTEPQRDFLAGPWLRAGNAPLNLLEVLAGPKPS